MSDLLETPMSRRNVLQAGAATALTRSRLACGSLCTRLRQT
jgi:hypothetical protein